MSSNSKEVVHDTDGDDAWQRSKSSKHTVVLFDLKLEASGTYRWGHGRQINKLFLCPAAGARSAPRLPASAQNMRRWVPGSVRGREWSPPQTLGEKKQSAP